MDYKLLEALCNESGVSGFEKEVLSFIADRIKDKVDGIEFDTLGNLIAFKKGTEGSCGKKILYSCHADEVGFVIKHIEEDGTLLFDDIGMNPLVYVGRRVLIGKNKIPGIIATKPVHLLSKEERDKRPKKDELYIDIGATSRKEAEGLNVYANYAVFDTQYCDFGEDMIKAKAIDDRIGCALLVSLIERGVKHDSYFAFCVEEEIGCRGSKVVAQKIQPDICINVECTTAGDIYGVEGASRTCLIGGGVVSPYMDGGSVYTPSLFRWAKKLAEENNIPFQTKTKVAGGTDASSYTKIAGGCAVLGIALPTRYIHSASCVTKKSDVEATEKLVFEVSDNIADITSHQ